MRLFVAINLALLALVAPAAATVTLTKAQPRYPWNGLVDFTYTISGRSGYDEDYYMRFTFDGVVCSNFTTAAWCALPISDGTHTVTWDAKADGWNRMGTNATAKADLVYDPVTMAEADYIIIDISAGSSATEYPLRYVRGAYPSTQFLRDEYKTTKIVLKKVPHGEFKMGNCNTSSAASAKNTAWHWVRLTQDFFLGVFEVTQQQYVNVYGSNPSGLKDASSAYFSPDRVNMRPVERLQYNATTNTTGFIGKLSSKAKCRGAAVTPFLFPTEAQWEYACRAGCESNYYWKTDTCVDLTNVWGWYSGTDGGMTHEVGTREPNDWGFYDMAGNVGEYCMDWVGDYGLGSTSPIVEDPTGPASGTYKIIRGGSYYWGNDLIKSGNRTQPGNPVTPDRDVTKASDWGGAWMNSLGMRVCTTVPK